MKRLFLFLVLVSFIFSANTYLIRADYTDDGGYLGFHVDQQFTVQPECTVNGKIISGDPCTSMNSQVCAGTIMTYTPSFRANWGKIDHKTKITASFPTCICELKTNDPFKDKFDAAWCRGTKDGKLDCSCVDSDYSLYCSENYVQDSQDDGVWPVGWLSHSTYKKYDIKEGGYTTQSVWLCNTPACRKGTTDPTMQAIYNELKDYYKKQRFDWYEGGFADDELYYYNKLGYAEVFCKGNYEVKYDGTILKSGEMPASDLQSYFLWFDKSDIGKTIMIGARLFNVSCFASKIKHPINSDKPYFMFNIEFNAYNAPEIPEPVDVHFIKVVNTSANMEIVSSEVVAWDNGSNYLIKTVVRNTGDVRIKVNETKTLLSNAAAQKMDSVMCNALFSPNPPKECSYPNGYDSYFNRGEEKTIYTLFGYEGDKKDFCNNSLFLRLTYTTEDPTCSNDDKWFAFAKGPCVTEPPKYPPKCVITPATNTINPLEIHEWDVTCYDENNKTTRCIGNDWRLQGISGDFITKTNEKALAYSTDTTLKNGKIIYKQGEVQCNASITVNPRSLPLLACTLKPSSYEMLVGEEKDFNFSCSLYDGSSSKEVTPLSADYKTKDGLIGNVKPDPRDPTKKVYFGATEPSFGKLMGIGYYQTPSEPTLRGAVAFSLINVNESGIQCKENETLECSWVEIPRPFGGTTYIQQCECVPKTSNETQPGGNNQNIECVINPPKLTVSLLQYGVAKVICLDKGTFQQVECGSDVKWSIDNTNIASIYPSGITALITANGRGIGNGTITAKVGDNTQCESQFSVLPYTCLEIS